MMKRIISILFTVLLLATPFLMTSCEKADEGEETVSDETTTLYVYNWGEYISDGSDDSLDVNRAFEEYCRKVLKRSTIRRILQTKTSMQSSQAAPSAMTS